MAHAKQSLWLLVALSLTAILYVLMLIERQPVLVSDAKVYYDEGIRYWVEGSLSEKYKFFQSPGYPVSLGFFLQVFGKQPIVGYGLNIVLYILMIRLLLSRSFPTRWSIRWGMCAILALNVGYVPLLGNLLSEVWFGFWVVVFHVCLYWYFDQKQAKHWLFLSFLAVVMAQWIRPVILYYLVFAWFAIIAFTYLKSPKNLTIKPLLLNGVVFIGLMVFCEVGIYRYFGYGNRWQPVQDGAWGMFYGAHPKGYTFKSYTDDISRLEKEANLKGWGDTIKQDLRKAWLERVSNHYGILLKRMPAKLLTLLNPYPIAFSGVLSKAISHESPWKVFYKIIFLGSSIIIMLVYLFNFWGLWRIFKSSQKHTQLRLEELFFVGIMGGFLYYTLFHLILIEAQPRYFCHFILLNIWVLPVSWRRLPFFSTS